MNEGYLVAISFYLSSDLFRMKLKFRLGVSSVAKEHFIYLVRSGFRPPAVFSYRLLQSP